MKKTSYAPFSLGDFVERALEEDIRDGDHTTLSCIPETSIGSAELIVKENGVLAGVEVAKQVFQLYDETLELEEILHDGELVTKGQIAFKIHGKERSIVTVERLVLNLMQRMSGISTTTAIRE